jgi:uncharacterized protein (DUF433 family)
MSTEHKIDWSQCPLVESNAKVLSGSPVLRGTRMPADAIVDNLEYSMKVAEIAEQFEISSEQIEAVILYAKDHRVAGPVR